jgi:hypothetical protein
MKRAAVVFAPLILVTILGAQEKFQVLSTVDAPSIAGRPVRLDGQGKLP